MKNTIKKFMALALAALICCPMAACGDPDDENGANEKIDPHRTQLYVYNFYGGYGSDWLSAAKLRYEELHKDDIYEDGKKGIQIYINNQKTAIMGLSGQILDNRDEVYFTEYAYYYTLKNEGVLGDISEAVTKPLKEYGESRSIKDKMSRDQQAYYGVGEGDEAKYYAVPHYAGYSGLIYNIDLFEEEGYYFAKTPSDNTREGRFIDKFNTVRSAGPDGEFGTSDDGLPATYEEFFVLCDFIADNGQTPIIWNGANYKDYLNNLTQALIADYEGLDQMMLNYTLNGTATSLSKISGGNLVADEAPTAVKETDAWQLARQAGKYYGLSFLEKLVTTDGYHNKLAFNGGYSHMNAQEDFLYAGYDGKTKPAAMLCDGCWWEMEAKDTFTAMEASKGEKFSKYERNFGFMPLPKATAEKAAENVSKEKKNTLYDEIYSICFMKANVADWKKPLALDFIRFVNSDESLREFTSVTNTVKALDYTMSKEEKEKLTPFGKSLMELKEKSDVVYPYSTNAVYANNQAFFGTHESFRSTVSTNYQWPAEALHENGITAAQYFAGMETYYRNNWASLLK